MASKIFDDDLKKLEEILEKGNKKFKELLKLTEIATPSKTPSKETKLKLISEKYKDTDKQEKAIKLMVKDENKLERIIELFKKRKKILRAIKRKVEKENKQ